MGKSSRGGLDDLLPAWGGVPVEKGEGENQRSAPPTEVFAGDPRPGKRLAPSKGDLTPGHTDFRSPDGFDHPVQNPKKLPGFGSSFEVFIQGQGPILFVENVTCEIYL